MLSIDSSVFLWLNATASAPQWLLKLALFSTQLLPALMIAGAVGAFVVGSADVRRRVVRVFVAMAIAWLFARLGQQMMDMPRPFSVGLGLQWLPHGDTPGFPSTHASVALAFGGAVAASCRRWPLAALAMLLACLVAWSRICLGLHFPSDVLAGAGVGLISAWVSGTILRHVPVPAGPILISRPSRNLIRLP